MELAATDDLFGTVHYLDFQVFQLLPESSGRDLMCTLLRGHAYYVQFALIQAYFL